MLVIIWRFLHINLKSIFWYLLFAVGMVWIFAAIFPSFADQGAQLDTLIKSYPENFLKAFGVEQGSNFSSFSNFISMENYSLMWPILVIILSISYASGALAGEVESGTMDILLAQPLSRTKIYWAKWLVGIKLIFLFVLISIWSTVPLAALYNVDINLVNHLKLTVAALAFSLSVYGLAFGYSACVSTRSRVSGTIGGIMVSMYAIDLVAKLKDSFSDLNYISLFRYFEYSNTLVKGNLELMPISILISVSIITSLIGYLAFIKRDIAI